MRVQVVVDSSSLKAFEAEVRRTGEAPLKAGRRFLDRWGRAVAKRAQAITPVDAEDGGELKASVRATRASMPRSGRGSVSVVAGGAKLASMIADPDRAAIYPHVQHEDTTLKHTTGQAKYIEKPFLAATPEVPPGIEAEMRREAVP